MSPFILHLEGLRPRWWLVQSMAKLWLEPNLELPSTDLQLPLFCLFPFFLKNWAVALLYVILSTTDSSSREGMKKRHPRIEIISLLCINNIKDNKPWNVMHSRRTSSRFLGLENDYFQTSPSTFLLSKVICWVFFPSKLTVTQFKVLGWSKVKFWILLKLEVILKLFLH